jgi:hypothetical protein
MPYVAIQRVSNLCDFLEYFINQDSRAALDEKVEKCDWTKHINYIYGYSFVWSFGCNFAESAHGALDNMMRRLFKDLMFPGIDTVFEYKLDVETLQFQHWNTFS